jgi:hypothetical protein
MLKYILFELDNFFKHFKQIRQLPAIVNIQGFLDKLGLSSILFNF